MVIEMNEQDQLSLCPKCGAHIEDGVCQLCGYEVPGQTAQVEDNVIYNSPDVYQTQMEQDVYQIPAPDIHPVLPASGTHQTHYK